MNAIEIDRLQEVCQSIFDVSKSIRILTHLAWPVTVRDRFFELRERELPEVEYPEFDSQNILSRLEQIRTTLDFDSDVNRWLDKIIVSLETSSQLLASCGTRQFFEHSSRLYGMPESRLADEDNTPLSLALMFDKLFAEFDRVELGAPDSPHISAEQLATEMSVATKNMFGEQAPVVQIVDELSANALAGPGRIRIRRDAIFTDRDVDQLIHHESHIHVATSLNGLNQPILKILGTAYAGTTRTQEGLAVFAEFITGSMDIDRFRRLSDRVIAIQMSIDGADFLEVYKYFLNQTDNKLQSFENARRVFRGGVMTGGAPFTKDIVYLDGLLRVHNFLRTMVAVNRADCLRLLFCGKLDLEDLPVLAKLYQAGICNPPKFLPNWAKDIRFLLSYLSYSIFLNRTDLAQVRQHYAILLNSLPELGK